MIYTQAPLSSERKAGLGFREPTLIQGEGHDTLRVEDFNGVAVLDKTANVGELRRQCPSGLHAFLRNVNHEEQVEVLGDTPQFAVFPDHTRDVEFT